MLKIGPKFTQINIYFHKHFIVISYYYYYYSFITIIIVVYSFAVVTASVSTWRGTKEFGTRSKKKEDTMSVIQIPAV